MASTKSDYTPGTMPVEEQSQTFGGFMNMTVYGGAIIAVLLLFPIFVFCTPLSWFPSLIITVIFGVILGAVLKLKGGYYAALIGVTFIYLFLSLILPLLTRWFGA
jgi:hypothetical protein